MKVKELIKKLKKCNHDEENFVEIATDYQKAKTL